ncbi:hypothetical protein COCC4DRAFT_60400 [Bipolaris maydis ATCC 48331]|uniref:Uncharacterized protein n=2 Tax=Cochliobolus heterostrophus TaxID=5016 RepID=M2ULV9_COCH5|nr:uncharacterized protein COCC4DRAFT_60400 [Bipolaris maydis ATCC 48331]EMD88933.1 hypothetical protein COCHEDRAFT_1033068 [Bipolaris maydis C5]ENI05351.1 hypothetical protein COCC4DRAFT_60400 [Bipolaris maydis ATCC 48331]KAJ5063280.1 hypothetical protein J3E74DRAFT_287583 [Bipolaris maydis]
MVGRARASSVPEFGTHSGSTWRQRRRRRRRRRHSGIVETARQGACMRRTSEAWHWPARFNTSRELPCPGAPWWSRGSASLSKLRFHALLSFSVASDNPEDDDDDDDDDDADGNDTGSAATVAAMTVLTASPSPALPFLFAAVLQPRPWAQPAVSTETLLHAVCWPGKCRACVGAMPSLLCPLQ